MKKLLFAFLIISSPLLANEVKIVSCETSDNGILNIIKHKVFDRIDETYIELKTDQYNNTWSNSNPKVMQLKLSSNRKSYKVKYRFNVPFTAKETIKIVINKETLMGTLNYAAKCKLIARPFCDVDKQSFELSIHNCLVNKSFFD